MDGFSVIPPAFLEIIPRSISTSLWRLLAWERGLCGLAFNYCRAVLRGSVRLFHLADLIADVLSVKGL